MPVISNNATNSPPQASPNEICTTTQLTDYANIARETCQATRELILKGCTQLENAILGHYERWQRFEQMVKLRLSTTNYKPSREGKLYVDSNEFIMHFYHQLETHHKYSFGNCMEMALTALEHIISHHSHIYAEVYQIQGGDHAFLVINRAANSDIAEPSTWGENAYICDPWSGSYYPASEYQEKLKNYAPTQGPNGLTQAIEDFNPNKHSLAPINSYNTQTMKELIDQHNKSINSSYEQKITTIITYYLQLIQRYEKLKINLFKKYGINNKNVTFLQSKILEMQMCLNTIREESRTILNQNTTETPRQRALSLSENLVNSARKMQKAAYISLRQQSSLNNSDTFFTLDTFKTSFFNTQLKPSPPTVSESLDVEGFKEQVTSTLKN